MALVAIAGVMGGRALVDDDPGTQVADDPGSRIDPYSAAAARTSSRRTPAPGPLRGEDRRRPLLRRRIQRLPGSARSGGRARRRHRRLRDADRSAPCADPARCAAVDVIPATVGWPTSSRTAPWSRCRPASAPTSTVGRPNGRRRRGRPDLLRGVSTRSGTSTTTPSNPRESDLNCQTPTSCRPAQPGREQLIAVAMLPGRRTPRLPVASLPPRFRRRLEDAWASATALDPS